MRATQTNYYKWDCLELQADDLSLKLLPQLGGRIIGLAYKKQELLFVQEQYAGETFDLVKTSPSKWRSGHSLRLWGGDKTWLAPQSSWPAGRPWTDLDTAEYQLQQNTNGATMISPVCRESGLQIRRTILLLKDNKIELKESLINCQGPNHPTRFAFTPWNVSQVRRPAQVFLAQSKDQIRPYGHEGDSTAVFDEIVQPVAPDWARIDCERPVEFKFGACLMSGTLYSLHPYPRGQSDQKIKWQREFAISNDEYLHDSQVEVYNSHLMDYLEIEVHAPYKNLRPSQETCLSQEWHFSLTE